MSLLVFNDNKTAMKENYIYQILKQFFVNSYPREIEEKVQKWSLFFIVKKLFTIGKLNV